MIKLVVSDLDGTLLMEGEKALREEVFEMLRLLKEKGMLFAVASGRRYEELKAFFGRKGYDIFFICENGALLIYKGKILFQRPISKSMSNAFLQELVLQRDCEWLAAGVHTYYTNSRDKEYLAMLREREIHPMQIRGFSDIPESILRISLYRPKESLFQKWIGNLQVSYEGEDWLDFTEKDVNKGVALKEIQKKFLKEEEETLAFGNAENDREILEMAEYAYKIGSEVGNE